MHEQCNFMKSLKFPNRLFVLAVVVKMAFSNGRTREIDLWALHQPEVDHQVLLPSRAIIIINICRASIH